MMMFLMSHSHESGVFLHIFKRNSGEDEKILLQRDVDTIFYYNPLIVVIEHRLSCCHLVCCFLVSLKQ